MDANSDRDRLAEKLAHILKGTAKTRSNRSDFQSWSGQAPSEGAYCSGRIYVFDKKHCSVDLQFEFLSEEQAIAIATYAASILQQPH